MKHRIITLTAFLLLGAAINIGLAWALSLEGMPAGSGAGVRCGNVPTPSGECLTFIAATGRWAERLEWIAGGDPPRQPGGSAERLAPPGWSWVPSEGGFQARDAPGHRRNSHWIEGASGWPLLSMRWCLERDLSAPPARRAPYLPRRLAVPLAERAPVSTPPGKALERVLPLDPVWGGFAANSMLYAAILWLALIAPRAIRRRRRIRRGECPACGYPAGTSEVCTECGGPMPFRHAPR